MIFLENSGEERVKDCRVQSVVCWEAGCRSRLQCAGGLRSRLQAELREHPYSRECKGPGGQPSPRVKVYSEHSDLPRRWWMQGVLA